MTRSDLERLKANKDQILEIETTSGEHLLIKVISVFDQGSDPDVFFFDVNSDPHKLNSVQPEGFSLPLGEIVSVTGHAVERGRA